MTATVRRAHGDETSDDEANAAMRAVSARLGDRRTPDEVTLRASVAEAMMKG